jgi:hypothetical protein
LHSISHYQSLHTTVAGSMSASAAHQPWPYTAPTAHRSTPSLHDASSRRSWTAAAALRRSCRKRLSLFSFPYVCPEPVLANEHFQYTMAPQKMCVFRTVRRALASAYAVRPSHHPLRTSASPHCNAQAVDYRYRYGCCFPPPPRCLAAADDGRSRVGGTRGQRTAVLEAPREGASARLCAARPA